MAKIYIPIALQKAVLERSKGHCEYCLLPAYHFYKSLTMKYLSLILTFCLAQNILLAQANPKQTINSTIKKVTLFTSGAQVQRSASAAIPKGKTELVFAKISPDLDEQSIQVKGEGNFTILSVHSQINYLNEQQHREEISILQKQKEEGKTKLINEKSMLEVFEQEKQLLLKNQIIGGQNNGLKASDLREAADFQRLRLTEVLLKQNELQQKIKVLDSNLLILHKQIRTLNEKKLTATSEIIVTINATESTTANFELGYFVLNAGWFAHYDLRVKDVISPIDLAFKATVHQNTGEDWKDVKLFISSGNPTENANMPSLSPWQLAFDYVQQQYQGTHQAYQNPSNGNKITGKVTDASSGEALIGANIVFKGTTIGAVTDVDGMYAVSRPSNNYQLEVSYAGYETQLVSIGSSNVIDFALNAGRFLEEVVVLGYGSVKKNRLTGAISGMKAKSAAKSDKEKQSDNLVVHETNQPTTVNFEIETPYTILSDGKNYVVDIKQVMIEAEYEYFAIPKQNISAFLTAKITNWQDLNLIDGEANLFFEGAYLGKSLLEVNKGIDTLQISLGKDKGIFLERKRVKDYTSKQFFSQNKTESRAFDIVVKNNKMQAVNITIQDQFPISTNKEISVNSETPEGATLEEKTQLLTWKYRLESKAQRKHTLKYSVKYPKNEVLSLE